MSLGRDAPCGTRVLHGHAHEGVELQQRVRQSVIYARNEVRLLSKVVVIFKAHAKKSRHRVQPLECLLRLKGQGRQVIPCQPGYRERSQGACPPSRRPARLPTARSTWRS